MALSCISLSARQVSASSVISFGSSRRAGCYVAIVVVIGNTPDLQIGAGALLSRVKGSEFFQQVVGFALCDAHSFR